MSLTNKTGIEMLLSDKKYSKKQRDEYAEQQSIAFFKWNAEKFMELVEHIQKIKQSSEDVAKTMSIAALSEETLKKRYQLFLKEKPNP